MNTRFRYILPIVYILTDVLGIFLSFYLSYEIRFYSLLTKIFPITKGVPDLELYLYSLIFVCLIWIFIFGLMGHYRKRSPSAFDRFWEAARGVTSGALIVIATTFFYRGESFSRLVMGLGWVLGIIIIFALREFLYRFELSMLRHGIGVKRAIFVGQEKTGVRLFEKLKAQPAWGIEPIGFVCDDRHQIHRDPQQIHMDQILFPQLGAIEDLDNVVRTYSIDMLIFNLPPERRDFVADLVIKSENLSLEYMISPDIMGIMTFNSHAGQIEGIPVIGWGRTPIEGYSRLIKRIFDIIFSGLGMIVLSPLYLVVAAAVRLDSPGPALFRQRRVGRNGREFDVLKFRSMVYDKENANGTGWTTEDDPRRTRVGKFIRRYSLDEMPQLWNVFIGEMSLVGPRPEQPGYVEKFKDDIPRYFQRHKVKSGVTGWAQVNGFRGDTSITERTRYDLYYVENWSLVYDIKIILLTLKNILKSPGAY